jgi:hypothetical protein
MIKAFTSGFNDEEEIHPNRIPQPPENEEELAKKKSQRRKSKRRSRGTSGFSIII